MKCVLVESSWKKRFCVINTYRNSLHEYMSRYSMNFRYARGLRYPNNISGWTCLFFLRLGSGQSIHCRPTEASPERVALINGNCRYCRIPKWRYCTIFLAIFWVYIPWTIAHCSAWNSNGFSPRFNRPAHQGFYSRDAHVSLVSLYHLGQSEISSWLQGGAP